MDNLPDNRMDGKRVLVTGANSGIGRATALGLASLGATVVMLCRSARRGEKALKWVRRKSGNEDVHLLLADLSSRQDIFDAAAEFESRFGGLDVLVNNAAVLTRKRRMTEEGFESQFFVNHLAYFMLTGALLDVLKRNAPSRIVNVASTAHKRGVMEWDNLQGEKSFDGWQQYGNTKLANILFTRELAERLEGTGVTVTCLHPGVIHTNLMSNYSIFVSTAWHLLQWFFKQPDEGAETSIYLASSPGVEGESGGYYAQSALLEPTDAGRDAAVGRRLWEVSESLTGYTFPD